MKKSQKERAGVLPFVDLTKEIKGALLGILYSFALIIAIRILRLNIYLILLVVCCSTLVKMLYGTIKNHEPFSFLALIKGWLTIIFIIGLFYAAGKILGFWGYILSLMIMAGIVLIPRWKQFMFLIKYIETAMYGKPIDQFKGSEFKNRKKIFEGDDHD